MRGRRSTAFASGLAAILVVGAAGGAGAAIRASGMAASSLEGTAWGLVTISADGTAASVPSGVNATLVFSGGDAAGSTGCNEFFAPYTSDGQAGLSFGTMATTGSACPDAAGQALEQAYLGALASVAAYALAPDSLTLSDASGVALLAYVPALPTTVEGPWIVTGYNNGAADNAGLVSPAADSGLSVAFGPDGAVEGWGGCNSFGGGYSVHGAAIAIGPLLQTVKACGEPLDTQETQYTTALQAATTWAVSAGKLALRDASGALQVEAVTAIVH